MLNLIAQLQERPFKEPITGPNSAFQPDTTGPEAAITSASSMLERIISNVVGTLTIIAGLAFLLFFVFGALQWILAAGEQGKIDQAKKQMTNGAIGLIIIIVSYAVIGVIGSVVGLNILNPACEILKLGPVSNIMNPLPPIMADCVQ